MKKILIFTYYWPPAGGVAVQRWLKFSKYLPEFGWEPIIITVENGSYPYEDESLLKEISPSLRVYRTKTFEPFELYNLLRGKKGKSLPIVAVGSKGNKSLFQKITEYIRANFFIPDARKGWVPYAVKQAEEILKNERIDVMVTTGPPHSTHLIGLKLKGKFGVKWVADFRDPWTNNLINEYLPRTNSSIQQDKQFEDRVLSSVDVVTVISEGMKEEFFNKTQLTKVIYNGYDEEDFEVQPITDEKNFTLRHVGNLIVTMNIVSLWQAITELRNENEEFRKIFRLEIIGSVHESILEELEKQGLKETTTCIGYVNHDKAVAYMKGASCLLFVVSNVVGSQLIISGKIFEYLATRKNILAIGPPNGNVDVLLQDCGREAVIGFEDKERIKKSLSHYFEKWLKDNNTICSGDRYLVYSRANQCKQLSEIL